MDHVGAAVGAGGGGAGGEETIDGGYVVMVRTAQQPIGSGFGPASTATDVIDGIDLSGKVAIVTGGHSGIGKETTRALRSAGAQLIVLARDRDRAAAELRGVDVEVEALDLLEPRSIDGFAEEFLASERPVHIVVNSAGLRACR